MEVTGRRTLLRQALYRFYAGLLLCPDEARLRTLREGAQWLVGALVEEEVVDDPALAEQALAVARWATSLESTSGLQSEWVRLFGASRDGYCFPYEGAHGPAEAAGPLLAELQKQYARGGLALSVNDLPDHVAVELEFMSHLCGLELQSASAGEQARRVRILEAQHRFLDRHLCAWLPALVQRLVACDAGPFALVGEAAHRLCVHDRDRLAHTIAAAAGDRDATVGAE